MKFDRSKIKMPKMHFITSENIHSVVAKGPNNVWIVGNHGIIYHSSDGGKTWTRQESGIEDDLLCEAKFVDEKEGWIVGIKGIILHTSNGGDSWERQESGTEMNLLDLSFVDKRNGWVVGEMGTILHTEDGGKNWVSQGTGEDKMFNGVWFVNEERGWVVGEFGTILYTEDGGKSWKTQRCDEIMPSEEEMLWGTPPPALYSVVFVDEKRGWIAGMDGVMIYTENGGKCWKKLPQVVDNHLYSICIKGNRGYIVGDKGVFLVSMDGGKTWTHREGLIKTKFWFRDIDFGDSQDGWIVGALGTVVCTKDGGDSWEIISGFTYEMEEYGLVDF